MSHSKFRAIQFSEKLIYTNQIKKLKQNDSILDVRIQVMHIGFNPKAVHPVTKRLLLTRLFDFWKVLHRLQARVRVEQVTNERQVQFSVSFDDILRTDKLAAVHLGGVLQHQCSKFGWVGFFEVWFIQDKIGWCNLK